jgi:hypothetical protein
MTFVTQGSSLPHKNVTEGFIQYWRRTMGTGMSTTTRKELREALVCRYRNSPKKDRTRILDEFVAVSGYHRKHAIRLLGGQQYDTRKQGFPIGGPGKRRVYDEAVKEALIVTWETADRICGKRLKAVLPELVVAMERHGHLALDPEVRERLLSASAATIDRLLGPVRNEARSRRRRRKPPKANRAVPVRTFADWHGPNPGYFEIDFVLHCGDSAAGSLIHTLVATDVCSGWTECVPLLAREQSLVVEGLEVLIRQIPFPVLGIDSDNDTAFVNDTVIEFCRMHKLEFTRCRPYHKNDQAWVEQKNGSVVRRLVGHQRFSGFIAGQTLAHLYHHARLYVNYFQPSFKLREKTRQGGKAKRTYYQPATPCARLLAHPAVDGKAKEILRRQRAQLDPVQLLHRLRESQAALAALVCPDKVAEGPGRKTLDQFLSQLPQLWRSGEVRPTHRTHSGKPRHWRTRKDPFEAVWLEILAWLQRDPDATAKELFGRLQRKHPGVFPHGQLRTLQRRVKEWRQIMAKKLVYACLDGTEEPEVEAICAGGANQVEHTLFQSGHLQICAESPLQSGS